MPSQDLVTDSSPFKFTNDNKAASNAFSNEAWDCIDMKGRKANCSTTTESLGVGLKAVGGAASASASRSDSISDSSTLAQVMGKDLTVGQFEKTGPAPDWLELRKQPTVGNDAKENHKDKNLENDAKKKEKDNCLDFNAPIDGYPRGGDDPRKTQEQVKHEGGHGKGGGRKAPGGAPVGQWREHVPPSGILDQEYGSSVDKGEDKNH